MTDKTTQKAAPKRKRKRLRTRILLSVVSIGTLLSILFATFALMLRSNLEERIIDRILAKEVESYGINFDPSGPVQAPFSLIRGGVYSDNKAANIPKAWQNLPPGVHDRLYSRPCSR